MKIGQPDRIDASKKTVGRIASRVAFILQGKHMPGYRPYKLDSGGRVIVTNADKMVFTGRKISQKTYYRHSGYIGHLKKETLRNLMERDSREVIRRAVRRMLPKNRLLRERMKNLILYKNEEKS